MFISLKNDFKVDREKDKETPGDIQLTANWIHFVVQKGYPGGLSSDKRRIFAKIAEKIEVCVEKAQPYLEVNQFEQLFLKQAFETAVIDPKFTHPVTVVEEAVMGATQELPAGKL